MLEESVGKKKGEIMVRRNSVCTVFFLTLLIIFVISLTNTRVREVKANPTDGPRAPQLVLHQYSDYKSAWSAFAYGIEDYFGPVQKSEYNAAIIDPEIVLQPHMGLAYTEESFMDAEIVNPDPANLDTPWIVGGTRGPNPLGNPLHIEAFKKALLCLANRDYWVDVIYQGLGERCDAQIPASTKSWWNPAITGANYPFPYDLDLANKLLDHAVEFFDMFHVSSELVWIPESGLDTVIIPGVHYVGGEILLTTTQPVVEIEHVYALYPNGTSIILKAGTDYIYVGGRTISIMKPGLPESTFIFVEYIGNIEEHFHVPENATAPGTITLTYPVSEVVRVRTAQGDLIEGLQWNWIVSTRTIEIYESFPPCTDVWVEYWFGFLDLDQDGKRNFPHGWLNAQLVGGVPENIPPLLYYCYETPTTRAAVANHWAGEMLACGIQTDVRVRASAIINDVCFWACSYQITTDGWNVGRYPDQIFWFFYSGQHALGYNAYTPGYADLDYVGERIFYSATMEEFYYWVQIAQFLHMKKYALSNQWMTAKSFIAYRNLLGMVYTYATGLFETYSQLGMYRADDPYADIRVALYPPLTVLNPAYPVWANAIERFVLGQVMEDPTNLNPWDIMTEQPGLAKDWELFSWLDPDDGETKVGIRYWVRTDAKWVKWDTGTSQVAVVAPYGARDTETSDWYIFQTPQWWWHASYQDIHHIRTNPANDMIEYYFNDYALIWYMDMYPWAGPMSPQAYKQAPLATLQTRTFVEGLNLTDPLDLPWQDVGAPFEIVYVKENGVNLTRYTDYEIVKGYVKLHKTIAAGATVEIQYWSTGSISGYTPGGIDWRLTVGIGNGPWVMKEVTMGAGGVVVYVRNPYCIWETPPYGEVDWKWCWADVPKPRGGYFHVNIYDIVLVTGSYETQGRRVPDRYWFAGGDFAPGPYDPTPIPEPPPPGPGKIDIFDIVSATSSYEKKHNINP